MQSYVFVILIRFLAVSWIQGCFYWFSSPIGSGVMTDQMFTAHCRGPRGASTCNGMFLRKEH